MTDCTLATLPERQPGDIVSVAGVVANLSKRVTRRGEVMVTLQMEDLSGAGAEVILFPRVYEQFGALLGPDVILIVKGRVDQDVRDDSWKLMALELVEPRLDERPFEIKLRVDSCTSAMVERMKEILANHPGNTQVFLHLNGGPRTTVLRLGSQFCVDKANGLHAELKATLGSSVTISG